MRKRILLFIVLVGMTSATAYLYASRPTDHDVIEQAVLKVHEQMTNAGQDVDKFFDFILEFDNGMIIQDGALFETSQQAYDAVKKGYEGLSEVTRVYDRTYVTILSPESALLTGTGTTKVTLTDGRTFEAPFAVSMVFVLREGQWKVLHGHYSIPNVR